MKISEIAKRYNIDTTELVCAIGALGQELTPDDEIDLNEEMAKGISEMLGVTISPIMESAPGEGRAGTKTAGEPIGVTTEGKMSSDAARPKSDATGGGGNAAQQIETERPKEGQRSEDEQARTVPPGNAINKRQRRDSGHEEGQVAYVKAQDKPTATGDEQKVCIEQGIKAEQRAHGQRGIEPDGRGNGEEAARVSQDTKDTPGGQTDVPEDGGDERRALLGDAEPPSDPTTKIILEEGKEIPVKEQVIVSSPPQQGQVAENPPQDGVPIVEEVLPKTDAAISKHAKGLSSHVGPVPVPVILSILGVVVLVVVFILLMGLIGAGKKEKVYSIKVSMKDYEVFAVIEKAIEKGKLSTAKDLFIALEDRFPESQLLDDAAISIADGYFDASQTTGSNKEEYLENATRYYDFAMQKTETDQVREYASFRYARSLYNMGRLNEAIDAYKRFMEAFSYSRYGADAIYDMAMGYLNKGEKEEAKIQLWKFVAKYYDDKRVIDAYLTLAEIFDKENANKEVQQIVDIVLPKLKDYPNKVRFYFLLARTYLRQNAIKEAAEILAGHLEEANKTIFGDEYYASLVEAYFGIDKPEAGIKIALLMSRRFPSSPLAPALLLRAGREAMRIKDYDSAREIFFIVKEKYYNSGLAPEALIYLSKIASIKGDFLEAIKWSEELLKKYPDYDMYNDVLWRLSKYYQLNGEHEQSALKYSELATRAKDPRTKERVWLRVIESYLRARMHSKAAQICRQVLDEYKDSTTLDRGRIVYMLGVSFMHRGQYADAIANFKYCISSFPLSPWRFNARYMLARVYEEIMETTSAITNYELLAKNRFISDRRIRVLSFLGLARIYTKLEMWDEARASLKEAMQINNDWDVHNKILLTEADLDAKLKEYGKAENLLKSYISRLLTRYNMAIEENNDGIKLKINDEKPHYNKELAIYDIAVGFIRIGDLFFSKQDYEKANKIYENAEKMLTTNGVNVSDWLLYQLANTSAKVGRKNEADAYVARLKELFPESAWAKEADYIFKGKEIEDRLQRTKKAIEELLK